MREAETVLLKDCKRGFVLSLAGAAVGALAVHEVDPLVLRRAIPVMLVGVTVYILAKPRLGAKDLHPRMERWAFDF